MWVYIYIFNSSCCSRIFFAFVILSYTYKHIYIHKICVYIYYKCSRLLQQRRKATRRRDLEDVLMRDRARERERASERESEGERERERGRARER